MLSVIVAMSPGREDSLYLCLQNLARQEGEPFEVLVSDDGSTGTEAVLRAFDGCFLRLEHLWRPPDRNLSRSRNRGAEAALGSELVFANCDLIFQPRALQAYRRAIAAQPQATFWGYVGCRKALAAPSLWVPEVSVNWLDFRFFPVPSSQATGHEGSENFTLWEHPQLRLQPHRLAGGHQFGLSAALWQALGPMNEAFVDWGEEDVEYALRALLQGYTMVFLGEAWAEHLAHGYGEDFHLGAQSQARFKQGVIADLEAGLKSEQVRVEVHWGPEAARLTQAIQAHYLKHCPGALESEMQRQAF